jgi:aspartyl-tRNA(Asn)/glutamyl-tRNA(Gln) amidotransferase subunit C
MSLTTAQVKKIADLAKLNLSAADTVTYAEQMSNIFDLITQMSSVDTSTCPAITSGVDMSQRLRTDEVTERNARNIFQSIAPSVEAGLYLVPQVIESE